MGFVDTANITKSLSCGLHHRPAKLEANWNATFKSSFVVTNHSLTIDASLINARKRGGSCSALVGNQWPCQPWRSMSSILITAIRPRSWACGYIGNCPR
jgi:hypothetical protein